MEILVAIVIPAFLFSLNWVFRSAKNYAPSAAADFILALMGFDLSSIPAHSLFETAVRSQDVKSQVLGLFIVLFTLSSIMWYTSAVPLEHRILEGYDFQHNKYRDSKHRFAFVLAWVIAGGLLAGHIYPFLYR